MVQFGEAVKRIGQLLDTKLDELFLALVMIAVSAVALFSGKITPDVWERITYAVLGVFSAGAVVRTVKGAGAAQGAVQQLRDLVAGMFGSKGAPTDEPPAPPPAG